MILVLDTSRENIFFGLWDEGRDAWVAKEEFIGGRELNTLIIQKLDKLFTNSGGFKSVSTEKSNLKGVIVNAGPGSFTGLRIGISVANTIAYTKNIPIVAPAETKDVEDLLQKGLNRLKSVGLEFETAVIPYYGSEPHITKPKN